MLLRRLTEHIHKQNWFAVLVDFAIVVMGVFIGIQVANWNNEQASREAEAQYLERFKTDLETTKARLERNLNWQVENSKRIQRVVNSLQLCELAEDDKDAFAVGLFISGKLDPPCW